MGVASGCGEQEAGVASGCGCKEVYRFHPTTYPYSSCICSFLQQHPYISFFKCFSIFIYIKVDSVFRASKCLVWSYHSTDIHSFFGANSSKSAPIASSSESEPEDSDTECLEPSPPKRHCGSLTVPEKCRTKLRSLSSKRTYNKKWEEDFPWLEYDEIIKELFASFAGKEESHFKEQEEHGSPNPSTTGKRQQKK